jgi:hypothetical protein
LPADDRIGGEFTDELAGTQIEYRYSTGNHYRLTFGAGSVTFEPLSGPDDSPYTLDSVRTRKLRDQLFMVGWLVLPLYHVTLILDFERQEVHVSAMMQGAWEFFDVAEIIEVNRGDGGNPV